MCSASTHLHRSRCAATPVNAGQVVPGQVLRLVGTYKQDVPEVLREIFRRSVMGREGTALGTTVKKREGPLETSDRNSSLEEDELVLHDLAEDLHGRLLAR
jgi:hypothetical protein